MKNSYVLKTFISNILGRLSCTAFLDVTLWEADKMFIASRKKFLARIMPTDNTLSWSWSRNYAESDLISVCQEFVLNGRKVAYGKQDNTQNIKKTLNEIRMSVWHRRRVCRWLRTVLKKKRWYMKCIIRISQNIQNFRCAHQAIQVSSKSPLVDKHTSVWVFDIF